MEKFAMSKITSAPCIVIDRNISGMRPSKQISSPMRPRSVSTTGQLREIITAVEADEDVRVLVFDSAVDGFFLNHSDFHADMKDLTSMPQGPTGLEAWPDILVR